MHTPEEPEVRLQLRYEILNAGFGDILRDLNENGAPELKKQLAMFTTEAEEDFADVLPHEIDKEVLEQNDPDEVYSAIKDLVSDPDTFQAYKNIYFDGHD